MCSRKGNRERLLGSGRRGWYVQFIRFDDGKGWVGCERDVREESICSSWNPVS